MKTFAERLKKSREEKKKENSIWTQEYIAEKIGVARVTYTAYERGTKQPPLETLDKIATLLDVTTDYLLGRSSKPHFTEDDQKAVDKRTQKLIDKINALPEDVKKQVTDNIDLYYTYLIERK